MLQWKQFPYILSSLCVVPFLLMQYKFSPEFMAVLLPVS